MYIIIYAFIALLVDDLCVFCTCRHQKKYNNIIIQKM